MKETKDYRKYSIGLKIKIAEEYLSGKFSYSIGAEKYGLKNKGVVKEFVKWYKKNPDIERMKQEAKQEVCKTSDADGDVIRILKEELALARLRAMALETMIDVAEDELGIAIRKKSGAEQSND